jgi:adenosine deaminase
MKPLVDLHRHLEGAIRPSTAHELAARSDGSRAGSGRRSDVFADPDGTGLLPYLAKIDHMTALVRTESDWRRVTAEAIADAYDDGLTAVELRFSPRFIHRMTGLDEDVAVEAIAQTVAESDLPIDVALIGIILRNEGPASAVGQMAQLTRHDDVLVGVDLAGDEAGYPAEQFEVAFRAAHDQGLHVTIHAGEATGPESVWAALRHLRPERIGHGVRSAEDPRLMDHLAEAGVTLEVAITSNVHTGAAASIQDHQLTALLAGGVRVAICTDNPTVSNTRLSQELATATGLVGTDLAVELQTQADGYRFR